MNSYLGACCNDIVQYVYSTRFVELHFLYFILELMTCSVLPELLSIFDI